MRIKTKKKLNLPELIQHVWENKVYPSRFVPEEFGTTRYVEFFDGGMFRTGHGLHENDTFTVEVEEELTEETVFDELVFVYGDYEHRLLSGSMVRKSIQNILEYKTPIYKIYALVDRSLILIWSAESGIPESGVLEVDAE